ncbi:hypothetical protein [Aestuariimicrobium ganziense]|uniref:hypothetical protein n=1 Tax=Aestuariimicrobium ganziense TaxID=2773677 RepID=UPI0019435D8E|nr:hypothetical protein [Aestuariimicrobium ganziense]
MSDDKLFRPRRAMPSDGEQVDPAQADDTVGGPRSFGRRGFAGPASAPSPDEDGSQGGSPDEPSGEGPAEGPSDAPCEPSRPIEQPDEQPEPEVATGVPAEHAAFMRPGAAPVALADALDVTVPTETETVATPSLSEAATVPVSQASPVEARAAAPTPASFPSPPGTSSPASPEDSLHAGTRPRRGLGLPGKVAAAVLAPALAVGAFFGVRELTRDDKVVVQQTTTTPSASTSTPTPTPTPPLATASLSSVAEATTALGGSWAEARTWETVGPSDPGITCMSNLPQQPTPEITRQRGLTSKAATETAVLQRMDAYATPEVAHEAYVQRLAALSACNDVPALLQSAASVTALADESFSMTVAFEDEQTLYHTVLISRTGRTVTMTDVANLKEAVVAEKVTTLVTGSAGRLCKTSAGTCPTKPVTRVVATPATPVAGWLAQSDLPRVTRGQGMWSPTQPAAVSSRGSQCEDLTLATAAGPTARSQRSYILTQDDSAPDGFGVDQVLFTFADEKAAADFSAKIIRNVNECAKRAATAKVSGGTNVSTRGADRIPVKGRVWKVQQAISADENVFYRVGVVQTGNRVAYVVTNTTESFDFSDESWIMIAARAGQRASQAE